MKNFRIDSNGSSIYIRYPVFIMNRKKLIVQAGFLILIMVFTLTSLFQKGELAEFLQNLKGAKVSWLTVSLGLLMAYILLESVILKLILHTLQEHVSLASCCKYSFVGFFFYCISPAGSAEQPMQLYFMHRDGHDASCCVFSLAVITLAFKLTLLLLGGYVYLLRPEAAAVTSGMSGLCILGFILTGGAVICFLCIICMPELVLRMGNGCIRILSKVRLLQDPDRWMMRLETFTAKYAQTLSICKRHPAMLLLVLLITIVQRLCFMAITAVSCRALGITGLGSWDITLVQGMIGLATEMLPVPGGMGINEFLYMKLLTPLFGDMTLSSLIVTRGVGFYMQLILCGLVTAVICIVSKIKERRVT